MITLWQAQHLHNYWIKYYMLCVIDVFSKIISSHDFGKVGILSTPISDMWKGNILPRFVATSKMYEWGHSRRKCMLLLTWCLWCQFGQSSEGASWHVFFLISGYCSPRNVLPTKRPAMPRQDTLGTIYDKWHKAHSDTLNTSSITKKYCDTLLYLTKLWLYAIWWCAILITPYKYSKSFF